MNLEPNRLDRVRDKLLSIEMIAYRTRHLDRDDELGRLKGIKQIHKVYVELVNLFDGSDDTKGEAE